MVSALEQSNIVSYSGRGNGSLRAALGSVVHGLDDKFEFIKFDVKMVEGEVNSMFDGIVGT
jgi:hypothetical protein